MTLGRAGRPWGAIVVLLSLGICAVLLAVRDGATKGLVDSPPLRDPAAERRHEDGTAAALPVRVLDPVGDPVRGARLVLRAATQTVTYEAQPTNDDGRTSFPNEILSRPDHASLQVSAPGYRTRFVDVPAASASPRAQPHVIVIDFTTRVRVVVLAPTGRPSPTATVWAVPDDVGGGDTSRAACSTVAGAEGVCEFFGLAPGRWSFEVRSGTIENESACGAEIGENTRLSLTLRTREKQVFNGQLLDDRGRPLAGALVRWVPERDADAAKPVFSAVATADSDGWFTLPVAPISGSTELSVRTADGKQFPLHDVWQRVPARAWTVRGTAPPDPTWVPVISGRVIGDDERGLVATIRVIANAAVGPWNEATIEGPVIGAATSNEDGSFAIHDIPAGEYTIVAQLRHGGASRRRCACRTALRVNSTPVSGLEIRISTAAAISGVVLDESGEPIRGLMLRAQRLADDEGSAAEAPSGGMTDASSTTDRRGRFSFDDLAEGRFRVYATSGGLPALDGGGVVTTGSTGIELRARASESVGGRVTTAHGTPVPGVRVVAAPRGHENPRRTTTTAADGGFEFRGLAANAAYAIIVAFQDGSASEPVEVWSSQGGSIRVEVDGGAEVAATIMRPDRTPAAGQLFWLRHRQSDAAALLKADAAGTIRLFRAAPGEYDVAPQRTGDAEILGTVRPGAPVTLRMREPVLGKRPARGR